MFIKVITTIFTLTSLSTFACTTDGSEGILPENSKWISASAKTASTIDEDKFNEIIDKVVAIYDPVITAMGGELKVDKKWNDGTVNAYASRKQGTWNVHMYGGLARHDAMTEDGFALVVCHELGHHIGGAPKKAGWFSSVWATNEGQADYFATLKCLRKTFREDNNEEIVKSLNVPQEVIDSCATQFSKKAGQLICQRGAMGGMSVAKLFQAMREQEEEPSFTTPDAKIVKKTSHSHPATQCRLDTYYAGALCSVDENTDVDQEDESIGVCYRSAGDTNGLRPLCWFKPEEK